MLLLPLVTYVSITKDMVVEMILQVIAGCRGSFRSFLLSIIQEVYDKSTASGTDQCVSLPCGVREKVCRD